MISEAQWLGLLGITESTHLNEWPIIQWTARRRAEGPKRFRDDVAGIATQTLYDDVILDDWQFSAFAEHRNEANQDVVYQKVRAKYQDAEVNRRLLAAAENCASWVLATPSEQAPIGPKAFYFFALRSMVPAGSLPKWDWKKLRRFVPPGVDPWRLICAEELE